jgi:drug/metabolite transporter (DMT)-like permease
MKDRTKGNLALLLTAIVWGTGFISQKLGNEVMPPMTFNAVRQLMAGMVLTPLVLSGLKKSGYLSKEKNSESELEYRKKRLLLAGVLCGIFMLIGTDTQQIGLLTVSAGKSGFISALYIVMVPFFSVLVGDKVKLKSVLCVIMAMIGFAVMSLQGGLSGSTPGDWWTLVSAAGFAAQIVVVNMFVDKDNALALSCLQFYFCGIAGLVIAVLLEGPHIAAVFAGMPILLYQTFGPTATGYTLQIVGQKYTDSSTAALIMSLEAVFAAIFGAIFLREMMSIREIAGAAIILAATIIGQRE